MLRVPSSINLREVYSTLAVCFAAHIDDFCRLCFFLPCRRLVSSLVCHEQSGESRTFSRVIKEDYERRKPVCIMPHMWLDSTIGSRTDGEYTGAFVEPASIAPIGVPSSLRASVGGISLPLVTSAVGPSTPHPGRMTLVPVRLSERGRRTERSLCPSRGKSTRCPAITIPGGSHACLVCHHTAWRSGSSEASAHGRASSRLRSCLL